MNYPLVKNGTKVVLDTNAHFTENQRLCLGKIGVVVDDHGIENTRTAKLTGHPSAGHIVNVDFDDKIVSCYVGKLIIHDDDKRYYKVIIDFGTGYKDSKRVYAASEEEVCEIVEHDVISGKLKNVMQITIEGRD